MTRSVILGTGSYVPEKVLTNADLVKMVDTTDQWIVERTGIRERRVASPDVAASDLAVHAGREALDAAGMDPNDIDLIIMTTITPDTMCPAGACWLQAGIGADRAAAFDLTASCSGFVYGFQVADAYIRSGIMKNILIASVDIMTREIDWSDRTSCVLWGDGAGAIVVGPTENSRRGLIDSCIRSNGKEGGDLMLIVGGGSRLTPINSEDAKSKAHTLKLRGPETYRMAVRCFTEICVKTLEKNGMTAKDVDVFIPHQANIRIIEAVAKRLGFPMDRVAVTIEKYGNMSAATIPVALDEWVREGKIRRGDNVLMAAFGGGATWGAVLVEW